MAIQYGVLRARPDRYKREDNASTPHLQIRALDTSGQPWRIAVNVQSDGGSNVAFYKQLKAAGIDLSKQALLTISVTEDEIDGIGGENIAGAYACMKYFQSLDNPNNKTFVPAFKKMWGEKTVIGDVTQAAYLGPWLWKLTAEKAGSFDIDKIAAASPGVEFKGAPEGYVRIHENHHLWSKTRVGRAKADGQYELIYETADLVEPDPFPKGYQ